MDNEMIRRMKAELGAPEPGAPAGPPQDDYDPVAARQAARVERDARRARAMTEEPPDPRSVRREQIDGGPVSPPLPDDPDVLPRPARRERPARQSNAGAFRDESPAIPQPDEGPAEASYGELRQALADAHAGGWIRYSVDESRGLWLMISGLIGFINSAATSTMGAKAAFQLAFRTQSEILGWLVGVGVAVAITIGQLTNANWYDEDGNFLVDRYRKHRAWLIPDTVFGVYYWIVPTFLFISTVLLLGGHVADVFPIDQPRDVPLAINYFLHQGGSMAFVVILSVFLSVLISVFLNVYGSDLPERAVLGPRLPELARGLGHELQRATIGNLFARQRRARGQEHGDIPE